MISCRISRCRPAPSAARTASSRSRAAARASSRLARLAEVSSSRHRLAPPRARSIRRNRGDMLSRMAEVADAGLLVGVRILAREALGDDYELGARLLECHARPETCHTVDVVVRPVRVVLVPERQHRPQLAVPGGKVEGRRHDADDGVGHAVETHRSPEHRRVTRELRLPQPIADDRCAAIVLASIEDASERRLHAEQRKHFGRDRRRLRDAAAHRCPRG